MPRSNHSVLAGDLHAGGAHSLRFHLPHAALAAPFGNDWFARGAEGFARFFGTPTFLIGQTAVVVLWVILNVTGMARFDAYPFILLNLAFSLQSAYAAPLILLAQTRQADRDKANGEADAHHREELAKESEERELEAARQTQLLMQMVQQNTSLTEAVHDLTGRVATLTTQVHEQLVANASTADRNATAAKSA